MILLEERGTNGGYSGEEVDLLVGQVAVWEDQRMVEHRNWEPTGYGVSKALEAKMSYRYEKLWVHSLLLCLQM
jgi:hypothetical protein